MTEPNPLPLMDFRLTGQLPHPPDDEDAPEATSPEELFALLAELEGKLTKVGAVVTLQVGLTHTRELKSVPPPAGSPGTPPTSAPEAPSGQYL